MTEIPHDLPPALENWIEQRVAEGLYSDASDYICDLIRRDLERNLAATQPNTAWLRERLAEAQASELLDEDPLDIIEQIIAEIPAGECAR